MIPNCSMPATEPTSCPALVGSIPPTNVKSGSLYTALTTYGPFCRQRHLPLLESYIPPKTSGCIHWPYSLYNLYILLLKVNDSTPPITRLMTVVHLLNRQPER